LEKNFHRTSSPAPNLAPLLIRFFLARGSSLLRALPISKFFPLQFPLR
jgi:hypothetical protein